MRKTMTTLLIFVSVSAIGFGQTKYYQKKDGEIIDLATYEKLKSKHQYIYEKLKIEVFNKDSIVYSYAWYSDDNFKIKNYNKTKLRYDKRNQLLGTKFPFDKLEITNETNLSYAYDEGKPTLITFWYSACKPCIEEMPALNNLKKKHDNTMNFIAITFNSKSKVKRFLEKNPFNFAHLTSSKSIIKDLGITSYPANIFLDKQGRIMAIKGSLPYYEDKDGNEFISDEKPFEDILKKLL